jgi:hypothetical protein
MRHQIISFYVPLERDEDEGRSRWFGMSSSSPTGQTK